MLTSSPSDPNLTRPNVRCFTQECTLGEATSPSDWVFASWAIPGVYSAHFPTHPQSQFIDTTGTAGTGWLSVRWCCPLQLELRMGRSYCAHRPNLPSRGPGVFFLETIANA